MRLVFVLNFRIIGGCARPGAAERARAVAEGGWGQWGDEFKTSRKHSTTHGLAVITVNANTAAVRHVPIHLHK